MNRYKKGHSTRVAFNIIHFQGNAQLGASYFV